MHPSAWPMPYGRLSSARRRSAACTLGSTPAAASDQATPGSPRRAAARIAHELRPRVLEDVGLVAAIQLLANSVRKRRGIAVRVEVSITSRLQVAVETTVHRLV